MSKFDGINRVIFDLDNTLIKHHFEREHVLIAKHIGLEGSTEFEKQLDNMFSNNLNYLKNIKVTKEYFCHVIEELMPILKKVGKTGEELLDIIDKYHSGTLMEGADELLEYLHESGYQIVAFTNWFGDYQFKILKKLGIDKYFERMYSWDDYYAKPHHQAMIRALGGTEPCKNVMIGDDVRGDVILPKSCGIKAIGFNVNYSVYKKDIKADADVTHLLDIKKYL